MPREATFRCTVLAELHRQLQWTSDDARTRLIDAAETLMRQIEDDVVYPLSFVAFRLTSWRGEDDEAMASLPGDALRADLVTMIQRVSRRAPLDADATEGLSGSPEATAEVLGVSTRTLSRLRPMGLVMRWARHADDRLRLACTAESMQWFQDRYPDVATIKPPPAVDADRIISLAAGITGTRTLEEVVRHVMQCTGVSHDRVRGVLRRAVARGRLDVPGETRLDARDHRLLARADRRGIGPSRLAGHLGVGTTSIHRALLRSAAARVRALDMLMPWADQAGSSWDSEAIKGPLPGPDVTIALTGTSEDIASLEGDVQTVAALRWWIHDTVASLPSQPSAEVIDAIETGFRVHAVLRWRVLLQAMPELSELVEAWCGRDPRTLPGSVQRRILHLVARHANEVLLRQSGEAPDRFLPRVRAALDRSLLAMSVPREDLATSQLARVPTRSLHDHDEAQDLVLEPRLIDFVHRLDPSSRALMRSRWGLDGSAPRTRLSLAAAFGGTPSSIARRLRSAHRSIVEMVRES